VEFLMSFVGVTETPSLNSTEVLIGNPELHQQPKKSCLIPAPHAVQRLQGPLKSAIMTAVHTELKIKDDRKTNIVILGLPAVPGTKDDVIVKELCHAEFQSVPHIIHCKRLIGKLTTHTDRNSRSNRPAPLLVILKDQQQAQFLLRSAKNLRKSSDEFTRNNIYINPHLTQGEAQAAYEARCRRRSDQTTTKAVIHHQQTRSFNSGLVNNRSHDVVKPSDVVNHDNSSANTRDDPPRAKARTPMTSFNKLPATPTSSITLGVGAPVFVPQNSLPTATAIN
jgi:hypothetical protein